MLSPDMSVLFVIVAIPSGFKKANTGVGESIIPMDIIILDNDTSNY